AKKTLKMEKERKKTSLRWSEWQSSAYEKERARKMFSKEIDDETESKYVLTGILKRKGLPLTTTYDEYKDIQRKTRKGFEHGYDEAYCDHVYDNIRKQPEEGESSTTTTITFSLCSPIVPGVSLMPHFDESKRELQTFRSMNGIIYRDPKCSLKRDELSKKNSLKLAELSKKFNQPRNIFAHLPSQQKYHQQQSSPLS
ncbi:hypothetical protein Tco_1201620, partial [Tanacetum coccineum]